MRVLRRQGQAALAEGLSGLIHSARSLLSRSRQRWRAVSALLAAGLAGGVVMVNPGWAFPLAVALAAGALAWELMGPSANDQGQSPEDSDAQKG
jgi:hypothetical protein